MEKFEKKVLIVEDDQGLQSQLKWHFDDFETTIITASNVADALAQARMYQPNIVIQDLGLPPDAEGVTEGFRCIQEMLKIIPSVKIIVLTGKMDHRNALKSIEMGAFDFYNKPVEPDTLDHTVNQAAKIAKLEWENRSNQTQNEPIEGLITSNSHMINLCRMVTKIGRSNITTTILGESGTGKEVIARAIHKTSFEDNAKEAPFVAINCAAVPDTLMESELFGYEKGAFTGASKTTAGKVEHAQNGTLFLDEIGDMPLALQAKLLRFLQQRTIERVGGRSEIAVNTKVVCATNKDLEKMVAEGTFREDLYYRIGEIVVNLPPLRDRGGDSVLIAMHILKKLSKEMGSGELKFSSDAIKAIETYHWPGNIRELENRVKRAAVLADTKIINALDLQLEAKEETLSVINLKEAKRIAEVEAIQSALKISSNNISAAAKLLGVTRPTLYDMMKKYSLSSE
jgi:two-component system NtrC family response regulator